MSVSTLFKEELGKVPESVKRQVDISFALADRIDACLRRKGMSQKELAKKMKKTDAEVSRWLSGTHNFTLRTICAIESALEVELISIPSSPIKPYNILEDLEQSKVAENC